MRTNTTPALPDRRRHARWLTVTLTLFLALCLLASPASAHASLAGGSVTDGQVLDTSPRELFLEFNEDISAPQGGLRIHDSRGERVDQGGTFQTDDAPELVRTALADDLDDGTYAVTYRVTSADGHPIDGALVYSVGSESAGADELLGQVFNSDADRWYAIAAAANRWLSYLVVLVVAGAVGAMWWLREEFTAEHARISPIVGTGAAIAVLTGALGILLQTILVVGDGLSALADPANLVGTLASFVGVSAVVRIVAAIVVAGAVRLGRQPTGPVVLLGATAMLGSFLLEGHTLTTGPAAVVWAAATVHLLTAALWTGGLVVFGIILSTQQRADDPVGAGRLVARFSGLFTVSVLGVLVAGSALSWIEVRAVRAALSTSYGIALLVKLAAVAVLLGLGIYNNRRLVPILTAKRRRRRAGAPVVVAGGSDELTDRSRDRDAAWRYLANTVRLEVGVIIVVLAVTGVLVGLQPAAEAAGITGAYSETVQFDGVGQMTFTVDPNVAGRNEIHLYLLDDTGRPIPEPESVQIEASQPELDIGPIEREPILAGPGHYILSGPELSVPGPWAITTEVAIDRFTIETVTVDVTVNP